MLDTYALAQTLTGTGFAPVQVDAFVNVFRLTYTGSDRARRSRPDPLGANWRDPRRHFATASFNAEPRAVKGSSLMKDDIIGKLKRHLSDPITTECAAIYLLVQVRKILEKSQPTPPPFVLWMYCHWAVHVDLTRDKMMRCFLEKIDRYVLNNVSGFSRG